MGYRKSKLTCFSVVSLKYVYLITCLNASNYAISYNMMKKHDSCNFCGDNDSYVHVGLYILVELPLLATFVGGSESSRERKFHTWNFRSWERMVLGAKSP